MDQEQDTQIEEADDTTPETQARARDMGWKPESEWKGKPPRDGFLGASEYVRRAEKVMPIVRAENSKLKDEVTKLRGELETTRTEQRQTIARIEKMSTLALQQQREQIEDKYAARKEAAVEVGDKDAYKQIVKDEREATKALDERLKENTSKEETKKVDDLPKHIQDTLDTWKADNRWFSDDPTDEMTAYATAVHLKLQKEKKGLTLKENLEEVAERVRKRFPEEFGGKDKDDESDEDEKPRGSRVEGGSRNNGGGASKSLASKLPADAKAQAKKFITDDGLFLKSGETAEKNMAQALERYAEKYFEGDAR